MFLNYRRLQLMAAWKKTNLVVVDAIYDQMYILYFTVVPQWALVGWVPGVLAGSQGSWLASRGHGWLPGALVGSQGSWFSPRGLGWLPGFLAGSQGSWPTPRGLDWFPGVLVGSQGL